MYHVAALSWWVRELVCVIASTLLASGSLDSKVVVHRAESGELVREYEHSSFVKAIAWSPNSALLASGGDDKKVVVRHAESGELVRVLAHDGSVNAITWVPDSALLASGCDNKVVVHGG